MKRGQSSYRLDGRIGWRVAFSLGFAIREGAIELATAPGSARPIASAGFGGLTTPLSVAADGADNLFLLDAAASVIKRYDACAERFETLACLELGAPIALAWHPAG